MYGTERQSSKAIFFNISTASAGSLCPLAASPLPSSPWQPTSALFLSGFIVLGIQVNGVRRRGLLWQLLSAVLWWDVRHFFLGRVFSIHLWREPFGYHNAATNICVHVFVRAVSPFLLGTFQSSISYFAKQHSFLHHTEPPHPPARNRGSTLSVSESIPITPSFFFFIEAILAESINFYCDKLVVSHLKADCNCS